MSTTEQIDKAIDTLEQALQSLRDLGFLTEEEEE